MGQGDTAQARRQQLGNGGSPISAGDQSRPDSILTWIFQAEGGSSWGGIVIADSDRFAVGDIIRAARGSYTILAEDAHGADLTPFGFEDGEVFIEWYWDPRPGRFLPTRNGPAGVSGQDGLGSEFDYVWTDTAWAGFGLGGQVLARVAPSRADTLFTFTFEAVSGDRWMGELYDLADAYAPGQTLETAFGIYRLVNEAPLEDRLTEIGSVTLNGTYFDHASGAHLTIQGPDGASAHGLDGLGSERGLVWTGRNWADFGQGGAMQADVPPEFRPAIRGFGFESHAGGWSSQDRFPRMLADVDGDGRADVLGFGNAGAWVSLANGAGGFGAAYLAITAFGFAPTAGGWASQDRFPRTLADINADGRADVVGFGNAGVWADPWVGYA